MNKNREHDGPCLYPYVDHIWPGIITTIDVRRIDYIDHGITIASDVRALSTINGHGITTASDVRTTYSHPDDLRPTWNHYNQRCSDDLLPSGRLRSSHSITQSHNHTKYGLCDCVIGAPSLVSTVLWLLSRNLDYGISLFCSLDCDLQIAR